MYTFFISYFVAVFFAHYGKIIKRLGLWKVTWKNPELQTQDSEYFCGRLQRAGDKNLCKQGFRCKVEQVEMFWRPNLVLESMGCIVRSLSF